MAVVTFLSGGDLGDVVSNVVSQGGLGQGAQSEYVADAEDERLEDLALKVLAGTEDVWTQVFREQGWGEYEAPTLVAFSRSRAERLRQCHLADRSVLLLGRPAGVYRPSTFSKTWSRA